RTRLKPNPHKADEESMEEQVGNSRLRTMPTASELRALAWDRAPFAPFSSAPFQIRSRAGWRWVVSTSLLTSFWLLFFEANIKTSFPRGRPIGLGAMLLEFVVASLFVLRRQPLAVSGSLVAWLAATIGSFGVLAARPAAHPVAGLEPLYMALQL